MNTTRALKHIASTTILVGLLSVHLPSLALNLAAGYDVTTTTLQTNDLVYNAATNEYLASIPSLAGYGLGNSITRLSDTGQILQSTYVGSEPGLIALSSDGSTGYVGLGGTPSVRQFDAVTTAAGKSINLGTSWLGGGEYAEDIAVAPGQNDTIAVAMRNACCSPRHDGVAIFKDGVKLPNVTAVHTGSNSISFGASSDVLYGYNNETTEFGFRTMSVNGSGVSVTSVVEGGLYGFGKKISYDNGYIFSSSGDVIDPLTGQSLGLLNIGYGSLFVSAAKWGQAYSLSTAGDLTVYDLGTFTPVTSYHLGGQLSASNFSEMVLGRDGSLALRGSNGIAFLAAVPEASTWSMWAMGLFGVVSIWSRKRRQH